jgi:acylphosphatase
MAIKAKQVIVQGRVQGVGFRYFVQDAASRLGLTGSVRNLPDRTVLIVVEGEEDLLEDFLKEVHRGPRMARVERLQIDELSPGGKYKTFHIEGW